MVNPKAATLLLDLLGVLLLAAGAFTGLSLLVAPWAGFLAAGVVVIGASWFSDLAKGVK